MLQEGDTSPNFSLIDQTGKLVKLSDFKNKTLVIYFYPKDDTPGCTKEPCDFNSNLESFRKSGVEIVGISSDGQKSHKNSLPNST